MAAKICYDMSVERARTGQTAVVRGAFHRAKEASSLRKVASAKA